MHSNWNESEERIAARKERILEDYRDFPGAQITGGLREALTTPGHLQILKADYDEAMQDAESELNKLLSHLEAFKDMHNDWSNQIQQLAQKPVKPAQVFVNAWVTWAGLIVVIFLLAAAVIR